MPVSDENRGRVAQRLQIALLRESLALVEDGVATEASIDSVVRNAIGRRWAVGGPFEIWEQIGWDLVQIIAGELFKEISVATAPGRIPDSKPAEHKAGLVDAPVAKESEIKHVAVVGAGLMGHGIALEFAAHGKHVSLHDISENLLGEAMVRARTGLMALVSSGRISEDEIEPTLARISISTDLHESVKQADLVIEAASENLQLKQQIFSAIGESAPSHAILASNSSTFVPSAYGSATDRPDRVVGIHYYNPPHLLPGIEVVRGPETSQEVVEIVVSEYRSIGKTPAIVQREIQGFIGNRLQVALLREAMAIVEDRIATAPQVDEIVRNGFGKKLPEVGVFGLVGNGDGELSQDSADNIFRQLNNARELPRLLLDKIESGDLGVKTGIGFYDWTP